jgi:hypothetical protein
MATTGFKLDIAGLEKQINQLKKNIQLGVRDGFENSANYLVERMTFYVTTTVYRAYFNPNQDDPDVYHRTYKLEESIEAKVIGTSIYIYSSGVDYAERVLKGNDQMPYDFPWLGKGSTGDFRPGRDWITPTRQEIINHFNQSGYLKQIIIDAIQRRI